MSIKFAIGIALGFVIGFGCRWSGIPVPAPPVLVGALLVVAMTVGYLIADRFIARNAARHAINCGGPDGRTRERQR